MKRTAWTAVLAVAALLAAGCTEEQKDKTPKPAVDAQPAKSNVPAPPETSKQPGPAENPAPGQKPTEGKGDEKKGGGVAGAIGRALKKGVGGQTESKKQDPGEAAPFRP